MIADPANTIFQLALRFVNQTSRPVFLTGKAGTGKTTFLRYIRDNSFKKMAVVAPTGVAAINAGGVTMHSFFQLPFGPFLPARQRGWQHEAPVWSDPDSLFKNIRFNSAKRELLQELELLVIDEISMVRADTLDAVDTILRHFRHQPLTPFGGVQVLFIGDLFQLPPVVNREEWEILKAYYASPFFFDAQVIKQSPPVYLELEKIYRQNESAFISILNNIRNNRATTEDLTTLHQYYRPDFTPPENASYITLTSHNASAEEINQSALQKLGGKQHTFEATVTGEFNDKAYPAEKILYLKEGAQIMLIKNDKGETRRYFNGKIGTIKRLTSDSIAIRFPDEPDDLILEKEIWRNIRYNYDQEKDRIEEEELGTFSQYPIRLAWAITIHKSQGLTFERAIIDAGASFAAGQVYVALSRLTSLDGLVLRSRISPHSVNTDPRVIAFTENRFGQDTLLEQLKNEQLVYIGQSLQHTFHWTRLVELLQNHLDELMHRQIPGRIKAIEQARKWLDAVLKQQETAEKFSRQLHQLLQTAEAAGYGPLELRVQAAVIYFLNDLTTGLITPLEEHIQEIKKSQKAKKYIQSLQSIRLILLRKRLQLEEAPKLVTGFLQGTDTTSLLTSLQEQRRQQTITADQGPLDDHSNTVDSGSGTSRSDKPGAGKPKKGDTHRLTLNLFKEGITIDEIASRRGLARTTIESHLASFIPTGEILITELVPENKLSAITAAIDEIGGTALGPVKSKLGDAYSFGEIRSVMTWLRRNVTRNERDDLD